MGAGYNRDEIFANIGKGIARYNILAAHSDILDLNYSEWITLLNNNIRERDMLEDVSELQNEQTPDVAGMQSDTTSVIRLYLLAGVRDDLSVARPKMDDVLDALSDSMTLASDTVLENTGIGSVLEWDDTNNQTAYWTFAGVVIGANTAGGGYLYVKLTVAGAGHQVEVYKDVARTAPNLVAQGSIVGDGLVVLAQQNASGLTGTVQLTWTGITNVIDLKVTPLPDADNVGAGEILLVTLSQYVHDDVDFEVTCFSSAVPATFTVSSNHKSSHGIATAEVEFEDVEYGIKFTVTAIAAPFAVGDKFKFSTYHFADGKIQTYFVERFDTALPSAVSGAETVSEAFAS